MLVKRPQDFNLQTNLFLIQSFQQQKILTPT